MFEVYNRSNWCVVVVGDKNGPKEPYRIQKSVKAPFIFLSYEDQIRLAPIFANALPWNSFARKNFGYLYAIASGAEAIWDFDDDNMIKFFMEGGAVDPFMDLDNIVQPVLFNGRVIFCHN
jgi:hypothetical protein